MEQDNRNFDRLAKVLETFSSIEKRVDAVDSRLAKAETNLEWLMKAFWVVVTPLTVALVGAVAALIIKK